MHAIDLICFVLTLILKCQINLLLVVYILDFPIHLGLGHLVCINSTAFLQLMTSSSILAHFGSLISCKFAADTKSHA